MKIDFWSSTEYSGFLQGLVRELESLGFDAEQRFQISEASYRSAKSPLARLWLRVRQYLVYPVQLVTTLLFERRSGRRADVCVISTNTFYAPLLATWLHPNVVHLVYDLFPEAMIHSGKWAANSLKARGVRWITHLALRKARQNVFLGQRLKDYAESQYGTLPNATVIEVGADRELFKDSANPEKIKRLNVMSPDKTAIGILYCGNFGNLHDSATLFDFWKKSAERLRNDNTGSRQTRTLFQWRFHCSGPKRTELIKVRDDLPDGLKRSIQIGGSLGLEEWISAMESAEIALVTMAPGSETVVMPSKTYSAMMAGQAILAIAPEASDLVDRIKAYDCGWWVEPGDVSALEELLERIYSDPEGLLDNRIHSCRYAHERFGQDALARQWQQLFEKIFS